MIKLFYDDVKFTNPLRMRCYISQLFGCFLESATPQQSAFVLSQVCLYGTAVHTVVQPPHSNRCISEQYSAAWNWNEEQNMHVQLKTMSYHGLNLPITFAFPLKNINIQLNTSQIDGTWSLRLRRDLKFCSASWNKIICWLHIWSYCLQILRQEATFCGNRAHKKT